MTVSNNLRRLAGAFLAATLLAGPGAMAMPFSAPQPHDPVPLTVKVAGMRGITKTAQLPTPRLRGIRQRMVKGRSVPMMQLRELADLGDSLAAIRFAKQLEKEDRNRLAGDALHYYGRAAFAGREYAIGPMVRILREKGTALSQNQLKQAELVLQSWSSKGSPSATDALTAFYRSGKPFGQKPEELAALMRRAAESGDGKVALDLAMSLLAGTPSDAAREEARGYLKVASASQTPAVKAMAENLLRRVGTPDMSVEPVQ